MIVTFEAPKFNLPFVNLLTFQFPLWDSQEKEIVKKFEEEWSFNSLYGIRTN